MMNIVFAGCSGAYGHTFSAVNTKTRLMALGLIKCGANCSIYDGLLGYGQEEETFMDEGIEVLLPKRKGSVITGEIKNIPHFYRYLKNKAQCYQKNILVVELPLYHNYLAYTLCAKLLGYKIIVIAHEWAPTLVHKGIYSKLSSFLYTNTFGYFVNGAFPISEYIIKKMAHFKKPYLKVPAIAEFNNQPIEYGKRDSGYFVYCANANYARVANLVIDSFCQYKKGLGSYNLKLILSGSQNAIDALKERVNHLGINENVTFYSKLPYEELYKYYQNASALIIPLDPEYEQDTARFPQKIAEYCSAATPILTTDVGEAKVYFDDSTSIKAKFNVDSFCEKMKWIENNPCDSACIGQNGYKLGLEKFEFICCGKKMYDFINTLFE